MMERLDLYSIVDGVKWMEPAVRLMRDNVYGHRQPEHSWDNCKFHWMRPDEIRWLLARPENHK